VNVDASFGEQIMAGIAALDELRREGKPAAEAADQGGGVAGGDPR
jgi:hypothetical protein